MQIATAQVLPPRIAAAAGYPRAGTTSPVLASSVRPPLPLPPPSPGALPVLPPSAGPAGVLDSLNDLGLIVGSAASPKVTTTRGGVNRTSLT